MLPPKDNYVCGLTWDDGAAGQVAPISVTARLFPESVGETQSERIGTPLEVKGNEVILPGGEGKLYVTVRAEFPDGVWTEHVFSYRSSILPTAFYDIEYGNNEGDVTLTVEERILKNGQDPGWYTLQSDSPIAARLIEGQS